MKRFERSTESWVNIKKAFGLMMGSFLKTDLKSLKLKVGPGIKENGVRSRTRSTAMELRCGETAPCTKDSGRTTKPTDGED